MREGRAPPPRDPNSFNFMQFFLENLANLHVGAPLGSWRPLRGEILDPPLKTIVRRAVHAVSEVKLTFIIRSGTNSSAYFLFWATGAGLSNNSLFWACAGMKGVWLQ